MKYYTPSEIADVLAKFAPEDVQTLLEPSVGNGNLLTPFLMREGIEQIVAIDKDPSAIEDLCKVHEGRDDITFVNDDFLEWSLPSKETILFDCVVMNPPFMAKNKSLIKTDLKQEMISAKKHEKHLPMEVVFVLRAIRLLKDRGKLLAIVPASVVNASKMSWLREYLLSQGHIERVYELPHYTFEGIEAKTFLLVFVKGQKSEASVLAMYDNGNTQEEIIPRKEIEKDLRLDYSYFAAKREFEKYQGTPGLEWAPLGTIARTSRGKVPAPPYEDDVIHYTNFSNGFWRLPGDHGQGIPRSLSDILICKRVGRDCLSTYGLGVNIKGARFSDCVVTIHIQDKAIDKIALLFALRTFFALPGIQSLLKLGTGASYISELQLRQTRIPFGLHTAEPELYREYQKAVRKLNYDKMKHLEGMAAGKISEYAEAGCLDAVSAM